MSSFCRLTFDLLLRDPGVTPADLRRPGDGRHGDAVPGDGRHGDAVPVDVFEEDLCVSPSQSTGLKNKQTILSNFRLSMIFKSFSCCKSS